jgi:hypothetical protein
MKTKLVFLAWLSSVACLPLHSLAADNAGAAAPADPKAAFAQLKKLAGEWKGGLGKLDGPPGTVIYRVTANGNTVMETLFPGTDHEMISMYHLDGDELVLTHYCAVGNQPRMKLNRDKSTATELVFDFNGGGNLDPAKDGHIHCGRIRLPGAERLEADWIFYAAGKPAATNSFFLARKPE